VGFVLSALITDDYYDNLVWAPGSR